MPATDEPWRHGPGLIESMWRYRVLIVIATFAGGLVGYFLGGQQPIGFDAEARLFLEDPRTSSVINGQDNLRIDPATYVPQQAARAISRPVMLAAIDALDRDLSLSGLIDRVTVAPDAALFLLEVTGRDGTAEGAAEIANAVARSYMDIMRSDQLTRAQDAAGVLDPEIELLSAQVAELEEDLADEPSNLALTRQIGALTERLSQLVVVRRDLLLQAELFGTGVDLFEPAVPPQRPARPNPEVTAVLFALVAFAAASMFAYWRAARTQRVVHRTDPEPILGAPLLGEIPLHHSGSTGTLADRVRVDPSAVEAFEFVLSSIDFALSDVGGRSFLLTSPLPGDGKTSTALQLAMTASRDQRKVVLVDADIRVRGLSRLLQAEELPGLAELGTSERSVGECMRRYRFSEQSQVPVVSAGQRRLDATSFFRSHGFKDAIAGLAESTELVLLDSPPVLAVADATIAAGAVDGLVLVVSHGTLVSDLQSVRERLTFVATPLLGYVFNRSVGRVAGGYGYRYDAASVEHRPRWWQRLGRRQPGRPARDEQRARPQRVG